MKEIEQTKFDHKVFINGVPLFSALPKKEFTLFISMLELEIKDFYKDNDNCDANVKPP